MNSGSWRLPSAACFFAPGGRDAGGLSLRHPAAAMGSGQWAITASIVCRKGYGRYKKTAAAIPEGITAADFPQKSGSDMPNTGEWRNNAQAGLLTYVSSASTQPSQIAPMTDFRHGGGLHAHSGGTVPDLHRIHYSPREPDASPEHLSICIITVLRCFVNRENALP